MGPKLAIFCVFFVNLVVFAQTKEEMAASEYALAFQRQLGIVRLENTEIKARLLEVKTTNEILIANFNNMEDIVEYWKKKYNVSEREAKRAIRKAKRKAFFRGIGVGAGVVAVGIAVSVFSN